jgi:protocatechuate 3,4-dioxygenase beta subunit
MKGISSPALERRRLLLGGAAVGAAGLIGLPGCGHSPGNGGGTAGQASAATCVLRPRQTEGPYFLDEKLERADIRSDPSDGSVRPGVPLRVIFRTLNADQSCAPLPGAIVDVWQCDATGIYAGVADRNAQFDTQGKKFLRGFRRTDASGQTEFLTIYPGWYAGRPAHIHFKVRTAFSAGFDFTSQIYFPEAINDLVFKRAPYSSKTGPRSLNGDDGIFRSGSGDLLTARLQPEGDGYVTTFDVGLRLT